MAYDKGCFTVKHEYIRCVIGVSFLYTSPQTMIIHL